MEVCRSNYLEIVKIIPFSERRSCFCHFLRSNGIAIEKINGKNHIRKEDLEKAYLIYKSKPHRKNFFTEEKLIVKAFEDVLKFLRGKNETKFI
ncbi:hypothetical protein [Campylobacter jejuni]|uniref:hypothetical protein n=1 Tax=Campylobacter jejuni TaxID=197 RepID=UPI000F7FF243|nr:hypothetical protein [Campylobacter jejuni]RTJ38736.1 hypothetical protein C3H72_08175 [Campylobacter jejuni]